MNINDFPAPHIPNKLPINEIMDQIRTDPCFLKSVINAEQNLSEYLGYLNNLPNSKILITSMTLQEAVLSSKIEGTIATISDVVQENKTSATIKNDIQEIENYCKAIEYGKDEIKEKGSFITKFLIKNLHVLLLTNNVRGANKAPGYF